MIEVVTLGTGSPLPDANRAGPATLVRAGTTTWLVDAGRAVLMRLSAAGSGAGALSGVLLTHLHSDHITDLNDVMTTRWVTSFAPSPLEVHGPTGTGEVVDSLLAALRSDIAYRTGHHEDLSWPLPVEVIEHDGGVLAETDGVVVRCAPTDHRPVAPTLAYRVEYAGSSVVVAGDTVPCSSLDDLCLGADVLVITAIRKDIISALQLPRLQDVCDYHSSVEEAAQTAARAGVSILVLTHHVPAPVPEQEEEWRARAAEYFEGEIVVAVDLTTVRVG